MSLGLAITFGLMGIINMAHGEMLMIGSYTAYVLQELFADYLPGYSRLLLHFGSAFVHPHRRLRRPADGTRHPALPVRPSA